MPTREPFRRARESSRGTFILSLLPSLSAPSEDRRSSSKRAGGADLVLLLVGAALVDLYPRIRPEMHMPFPAEQIEIARPCTDLASGSSS
jgi:hypothetical protein